MVWTLVRLADRLWKRLFARILVSILTTIEWLGGGTAVWQCVDLRGGRKKLPWSCDSTMPASLVESNDEYNLKLTLVKPIVVDFISVLRVRIDDADEDQL